MRRSLLSLLLLGSIAILPGSSQDAPRPTTSAAAHMTVPDGFQVTLFAGEPDVVQPIAIAFDDRGRLWVAECLSYPKWLKDPKEGRDRIIILEDTDGDGKFDKRTVFHDRLANVSGLVYGHGGVWVCATPNLLFIPDKDGDDVPDGPPQVVLDGWDLKAQHNVFNGLIWGPDGWLYGCNGILSNSKVGPPGTPDDKRVALNCGVWRYHPTRKTFELVASGTTNPWGLDYDDYGQMFITNCVIHHLWHVVPGAHFQRMFGEDLNRHTYGLLNSVADHIHWAGGHWTSSRGGQGGHSDAGGGHAHSGAMIYLGDNWPAAYRNGAFMCNIHGNRINHDLLERNGSTYRARHGLDFLKANDPWFRGIALTYGPDGGVYVTDWTDTGECHNYQVADKTNGRIYKITYGMPKHRPEDLSKLSDLDLVRRHLHRNDWHVRHARRLLHERSLGRKIDAEAVTELQRMLEHADVTRRLRALWTLHCLDRDDYFLLTRQFESGSEHQRAWAVQFLLEGRRPHEDLLSELARLARHDPSPLVRLALASGLQRLPVEHRGEIARRLLRHHEDEQDPYLPLMLWYGVEPLIAAEPGRAASLLTECRIPLVREHIARRLMTLPEQKKHLDRLVHELHSATDPLVQRDILRGIQQELAGQRRMAMPSNWRYASASLLASPLPEVRDRSLALAVLFGDERALQRLYSVVANRGGAPAQRQQALAALLPRLDADLVPILHGLLDDPTMRSAALRGLAAFDNINTPRLVLKGYAKWRPEEQTDAIQMLAARPAFALALLDAVAANAVPRQDVSAFTIRQLQALKSPPVQQKLQAVWGDVRPPSTEKKGLIQKYKAALSPETLKKADVANGRRLYAKVCASCHKLFGEGGDIGPELTGSQRANLDYVLENVLDPNAIVPREYKVHVISTTTGRVITGIVKRETDKAITVQTQNEVVTVPKAEIESRAESPLSMMPEGLLKDLRLEDVRDLVGYLASPVQVTAGR